MRLVEACTLGGIPATMITASDRLQIPVFSRYFSAAAIITSV